MTIPLAYAAFLISNNLSTYLVALVLGVAIDWHLHHLAQSERC